MVFIGNLNLTEHKAILKLGGFISINVDVVLNPFCTAMRTTDFICRHCYAYYMGTRYPRLKQALVKNYETLSSRVLTDDEIIIIGNYVLTHVIGLRFNSLGELINSTHVRNLNLIAMYIKSREPSFPITIWTKRTELAADINRNNIVKIWSNPVINQPQSRVPDGFDGVFNVCDYDYFKQTNTLPNCGGHCANCMKCYRVNPEPFVIVELIKRDQTKIKQGKLEEL